MNFVGPGTKLSNTDLEHAAKQLGVPIATIKGVLEVEAAGSGFDSARRPKILPEPHVFYALLGKGKKRDRAVSLGVAYAKWGEKPYPKTSQLNYLRLATMISIDETAALKATSWGLPQILGKNFEAAGYPTVQAMVDAMVQSEGNQLIAMCTLIHNWGIADELQRRDAAGFARAYNGPAYAKNGYATKLMNAWKRFDKDPAYATLTTIDVPTDHRGPEAATTAEQPDDTVVESEVTTEDAQVDDNVVQSVQERLKALGYYEVGPADNDPASRTQGAILAFRNDHGLPLTPVIDDQLLAALATAQPRVVAPERATATAGELRTDGSSMVAPQLKASLGQRVIAWIVGIPAAAGSLFTGLLDNASDATSKLSPLKEFLSDVPTWTWFALLLALAATLYFLTRHSEKKTVELYQKGAVS